MNGGDFTVNGMINMGMNMNDVYNGVKQLQGAFNGLKLPSNIASGMLKDFDKLKEVLGKLRDLSNKQTFTNGDLKNLDKLQSQANSLFNNISKSYEELNGKQIYLQADWSKITAAQSEIDKLKSDIQSKLSDTKIDLALNGGGTKAFGIEEIISGMEKGVRSSKVLSAAMQEVRNSLQTGDFSGISKAFADIESKAGTLKGAGTGLLEVFKQMGLITFEGPAANLAKTEQGVKLLHTAFAELTKQFPQNSAEIQNLAKQVDVVVAKKAELEATGKANLAAEAEKGASAMRNYGNAADQAAQATKKVAQSTVDAASQVKQLQQSTQYFFSLRNMINLLKRGIREAVETVKELDAAMTETAVVVPEWNIGDMWAKLPEYTKNANELGAKVVDLYKATTLYYQQGLRGNEVMGIAGETMKMARIGGLEAADATDKMTAALRGFNMEINETSAQRINDVYSNLAANTASNTEELGTAMQRTASIAASAGMSFEGTAAFLAQAIETTREPAENLGTAMKTIVARFTELKKNPLEISEVEGEEVSYNKVDTALQSIGVSLKDANGQFRSLDQVFLDISQRWDSLTQTQQRYIATQAAGSRQQSRFIAMMSNYQRTTELMNFANNSEGASQKQFEKTLDSLEVKLTKLRNAWDAFLMGMANNNLIKGGVDLLTNLVSGVDDLINALSLGIGPLKSFLSVMTAFLGLKVGGRLINSLIGGLGGMVDPTSTFSMGFRGGAINSKAGNPALASQIYSPIVDAIYRTSNQKNSNPTTGYSGLHATPEQIQASLYKNSFNNIKDISKNGGTVGNLVKQLNGLDAPTQRMMQRSFAVTFDKATQSITGGFAKDFVKETGGKAGLLTEALNKVQKPIWNDYKKGDLPLKEFYNQISSPAAIKSALNEVNTNGKYDSVIKYFDGLDKGASTYAAELANQKVQEIQNGKFKNLTDEQRGNLIQKYQDPNGRFQQAAYRDFLRKSETSGSQQQISPLSKGESLVQGMGQLGGSLAGVGLSLKAFGSTLQNNANPAIAAFGTMVSSTGSLFSTFGMGLTGISSGITGLAKTLGTSVPVVGGWTAAIAAAAAVIGIGIAVYKNHIKKIKKDAKEVSDTYQKQTKESEKNISSLRSWQEELPRLSKGVDQNGNNINLSTSDYQQYLEIADSIAKLNPKVVKGYNLQGHAIIDNNTALAETLHLQEEKQKKAAEEFLTQKSLNKLIRARNLKTQKQVITDYSSASPKATNTGKTESKYQYQMRTRIQGMANNMMQAIGQNSEVKSQINDILAQGGIDIDALQSGQAYAINEFRRNYDQYVEQIRNILEESDNKIQQGTIDSFNTNSEKYEKAFEKQEELAQPIYEYLTTKAASDNLYSLIPEEMQEYYNQGLKELAGDTNIKKEDLVGEATALANKFADLTTNNEEYTKAIEKANKAQSKFGKTLDASQYNKDVQGAIKDLQKVQKEVNNLYGDTSYGAALNEFLEQRISEIEKYTEEAIGNVSEALNTMSDEITAAEGALETFQKTAEGSNYSTAATGMQEILNTVTETEDNKPNRHAEGRGDQTYWAAAEATLGTDRLKELSKRYTAPNEFKKVVDNELKNLGPILKEGAEGTKNFVQRFQEAYKEGKLDKLVESGKITVDKESNFLSSVKDDKYLPQLADALNLSVDTLTASLNKARQFFNVDFSNLGKVREALASSGSTINGTSSNDKGITSLYIKEETLDAELAAAGLDFQEREAKKRELYEKENLQVIKNANNIKKEDFQDMGIKNQESLIAIFSKTGQFTKDEIRNYAKAYADENNLAFDPEKFNENYQANVEIDDPATSQAVNELQNINQAVQLLANAVLNQRLEEGHLDKSLIDDYKQLFYGKKGKDTEAQLFSEGKGKNEKPLTAAEFTETKANLESTKQGVEDWISKLKTAEAAAKESGDTNELDKIQTELQWFNKFKKDLDTWVTSGTEKYNKSLQQDFNTVDKNFGLGKEGQTVKDYTTVEQQSAIQTLGGVEKGTALTDELIEAMKTLGLDVADAIKSGFLTDENGAYSKYVKSSDYVSPGATSRVTAASNTLGEAATDTSLNIGERAATFAEINKELGLTKAELAEVNNGFVQLNMADLSTLNDQNLTALLTNLGMTKKEIKSTKHDLENFNALSDEEKTIALRTDISGTEKVNKLLDPIIKEFGKGDEKKKSLIIEAEAKMAEGNQKEADELLKDAGIGKKDRKVVEKKMDFALNAGVANPNEVQKAINKQVDKAVKGGSKTELKKKVKIQYTEDKKPKTKSTITTGIKVGKDEATSKINEIKKGNNNATFTLKANTESAQSKISEIHKAAKHDESFSVSASWVGPKTFDVDINVKKHPKKATGARQMGAVPLLPGFESLASGKHTGKLGTAQIGPRDHGGPTLTGELGYEVVWLPKKGESMIVGANGPQMVDLPGDAVVWNHEQSKKILNQKSIPVGSNAKGTVKAGSAGGDDDISVSGVMDFLNSYGSNNKQTKKKGGQTIKAKGKTSTNKKGEKSIKIITTRIGKLSVWWENQTRKVDAILRKVDQNQKTFEKLLEKSTVTLSSIAKDISDVYIKNINQSISLNKQSKNRANKELRSLDKNGKASISWEQNVTTVSGKNKGKYKKLYKQYKKASGSKKNKYAKKLEKLGKTSKKTKKGTVNIGRFIKLDPETGAYIVDQKAINKVAGKNKSKAKAIKDAAYKAIDEKVQKRNTAEDNITKMEEQLSALGKKLYDTFYGWENELTKILNLTNQIAEIESKITRLKGMQDFNTATLTSGLQQATTDFAQQTIDLFKAQVLRMTTAIQKRSEAITAQRDKIDALISSSDEQELVNTLAKRGAAMENAAKKQATYNKAKKVANDADKKADKAEKKADTTKKLRKKGIRLRNKGKTQKTEKKTIAKKTKDIKDLKAKKKEAKTQKEKDRIQKKIDKAQKVKSNAKKNLKALKTTKKDAQKAQRAAKKARNTANKAESVRQIAAQSLDNAKKQLQSLGLGTDQYSPTEILANTQRLTEAQSKLAEVKQAQQYITATTNKDGTIELDLKTDQLEADKDAGKISEAMYNAIKGYYDGAKDANDELVNLYNDQLSALEEMYSLVSELKEQYADYADELMDAIEEAQKEEIDNLSKLNDALTNHLKDLLDEVKRRLDQRRQQEDNAKTESDINKKQQRLATLRADTSGGHASEIRQLEQEIAEAQQNYGRTLEDQTLQRLEDQADKAAQQRDHMIELLQAQLDIQTQGNNKDQVNSLLERLRSDDKAVQQQAIAEATELLKKNQDYDNQNTARQAVIMANIQKTVNGLMTLPSNIDAAEAQTLAIQNDVNVIRMAIEGMAEPIIKISEATELLKNGALIKDLKEQGFDWDTIVAALRNLNTSEQTIAQTLIENGFSGAQVQKTTGASLEDIAKGNAAAKGTDNTNLAGIKTTVDSNGAKKGGDVGAHVSANGSYKVGNKGSTLYYEEIDPTTGKNTGKTFSKSIGKITAKNAEGNSIEAKQAVEYAITHQKAGTVINKDLGAIAKALGINGNAYKITTDGGNKTTASLGNDGYIYWYTKNGIKQWNTAAGKVITPKSMTAAALKKLNKAERTKKASKATSSIWREYKQFFDANKLKYKTGGLATTTGPAWLDGTRAKPELVLNATDTKNFIALKDVLSSVMNGVNSMTDVSDVQGAPVTYDININVDHLNNDYDVDRVADRVKKIIVQDASYRNVTAVRKFR